ncbi:MotA/TolQ/ExbB proton channel family protein [Nitrospira sp. BLG_2]|uniref:MotA/TolQ/ExbB proton channel family protein n=1 Tax=Nitrospira sp. BLG_2 TaxID=3397507 RepID=UPI003B99E17C
MNLQAGPLGLVSSLGLVSKIILLFLFGFSVLSWAIILYKLRVYRRSDAEDQRFLSSVAKLNDVEEMRRQARRAGDSPSAAVLLNVLDRLPEMPEGSGNPHKAHPESAEGNPVDRHYLERSMAYIVQGQLARMESYLPFLATTGNITPFIGLLGTVLGIIDSFREIGQQGTPSIGAVAPGVAEALVATAMGLFTAIPAVVAYNYFLSRIRRMAFRLETFSVEMLNSLLRRAGARGTAS